MVEILPYRHTLAHQSHGRNLNGLSFRRMTFFRFDFSILSATFDALANERENISYIGRCFVTFVGVLEGIGHPIFVRTLVNVQHSDIHRNSYSTPKIESRIIELYIEIGLKQVTEMPFKTLNA